MKTKIKIDSVKGRGVYAKHLFRKGSLVEKCHLIIFDIKDLKGILEGYVFEYSKTKVALALGNGSLYNHSDNANAVCTIDYQKNLLEVKTKRAIKPGEEITIDYGYSISAREKFKIK